MAIASRLVNSQAKAEDSQHIGIALFGARQLGSLLRGITLSGFVLYLDRVIESARSGRVIVVQAGNEKTDRQAGTRHLVAGLR